MPTRIRLRRVGRKKQPSYRLVVTDSAAPRDGAYLETLGFYNPRREPAELKIDLERVDYWLERGVEITDTARSLIRKARKGGDDKVAVQLTGAAAPAAETAAAAEPAEEKAAAESGEE